MTFERGLRRVVLALSITAVAVLSASPAYADEVMFSFTWAFIESLHRHHTANVLRVEEQSKADIRTLEGYVDFMRSIERQNRFYQGAADLIGPYQNDQRLPRLGREIAQVVALDYLEMVKANQDAAALMRGLAPDADPAETLKVLKTRSQRLVEIRSRRDAAEEDLAKMGAGFGSVILGGEEAINRTDIPKDAPMGTWARLRLTRSERRQLVARLEQVFGPTVKEYVEKDEAAAPGAAVLLWQFLATSGFMASDDPTPAKRPSR